MIQAVLSYISPPEQPLEFSDQERLEKVFTKAMPDDLAKMLATTLANQTLNSSGISSKIGFTLCKWNVGYKKIPEAASKEFRVFIEAFAKTGGTTRWEVVSSES